MSSVSLANPDADALIYAGLDEGAVHVIRTGTYPVLCALAWALSRGKVPRRPGTAEWELDADYHLWVVRSSVLPDGGASSVSELETYLEEANANAHHCFSMRGGMEARYTPDEFAYVREELEDRKDDELCWTLWSEADEGYYRIDQFAAHKDAVHRATRIAAGYVDPPVENTSNKYAVCWTSPTLAAQFDVSEPLTEKELYLQHLSWHLARLKPHQVSLTPNKAPLAANERQIVRTLLKELDEVEPLLPGVSFKIRCPSDSHEDPDKAALLVTDDGEYTAMIYCHDPACDLGAELVLEVAKDKLSALSLEVLPAVTQEVLSPVYEEETSALIEEKLSPLTGQQLPGVTRQELSIDPKWHCETTERTASNHPHLTRILEQLKSGEPIESTTRIVSEKSLDELKSFCTGVARSTNRVPVLLTHGKRKKELLTALSEEGLDIRVLERPTHCEPRCKDERLDWTDNWTLKPYLERALRRRYNPLEEVVESTVPGHEPVDLQPDFTAFDVCEKCDLFESAKNGFPKCGYQKRIAEVSDGDGDAILVTAHDWHHGVTLEDITEQLEPVFVTWGDPREAIRPSFYLTSDDYEDGESDSAIGNTEKDRNTASEGEDIAPLAVLRPLPKASKGRDSLEPGDLDALPLEAAQICQLAREGVVPPVVSPAATLPPSRLIWVSKREFLDNQDDSEDDERNSEDDRNESQEELPPPKKVSAKEFAKNLSSEWKKAKEDEDNLLRDLRSGVKPRAYDAFEKLVDALASGDINKIKKRAIEVAEDLVEDFSKEAMPQLFNSDELYEITEILGDESDLYTTGIFQLPDEVFPGHRSESYLFREWWSSADRSTVEEHAPEYVRRQDKERGVGYPPIKLRDPGVKRQLRLKIEQFVEFYARRYLFEKRFERFGYESGLALKTRRFYRLVSTGHLRRIGQVEQRERDFELLTMTYGGTDPTPRVEFTYEPVIGDDFGENIREGVSNHDCRERHYRPSSAIIHCYRYAWTKQSIQEWKSASHDTEDDHGAKEDNGPLGKLLAILDRLEDQEEHWGVVTHSASPLIHPLNRRYDNFDPKRDAAYFRSPLIGELSHCDWIFLIGSFQTTDGQYLQEIVRRGPNTRLFSHMDRKNDSPRVWRRESPSIEKPNTQYVSPRSAYVAGWPMREKSWISANEVGARISERELHRAVHAASPLDGQKRIVLLSRYGAQCQACPTFFDPDLLERGLKWVDQVIQNRRSGEPARHPKQKRLAHGEGRLFRVRDTEGPNRQSNLGLPPEKIRDIERLSRFSHWNNDAISRTLNVDPDTVTTYQRLTPKERRQWLNENIKRTRPSLNQGERADLLGVTPATLRSY